MEIRWLRSAADDLNHILVHADATDPALARNIQRRLSRIERNIKTFPRAAFYNKKCDYYERYVPRTRIILIYQIHQAEIIIMAAFHTSRNTLHKPQ